MNKNQTIIFKQQPYIIGNFSIVGPIEQYGAFGKYFHKTITHDKMKEKTFEKAERKLLEEIIISTITNAKKNIEDIDALLSGDLLNQIISSSFAARRLGTTFIGLYGACSTIAEALALGSCLVSANHFDNIVCATTSHFSSAERQYRFPLELGNQRPPTSQWTVTGGGGFVVSNEKSDIAIKAVTFGKVIDFGIKDVNNMGAAMAPAAFSTILTHLTNTNSNVKDYDLIITGDLGRLGSEILVDLLEKKGIILDKRYLDCGASIYNKKQKVFMGGSGAGCCASVVASYVMKKIKVGEYNRVLFVATGALLSTTSSQQGDSIPCIAHAVEFVRSVE